MIWLIACSTAVLCLLLCVLLFTSGQGLHRRLLYHFYERLGPELYAPGHAQWNSLIAQVRGHERILDIGTAAGDFPLALAARPDFSGHITGIDWSPRLIGLARSTATQRGLEDRVQFRVVDVHDGLPFAAAAFDVVVAIGLLETLAAVEAALREMARVLQPGGRLILSRYRGWSPWSAARVYDFYAAHLHECGFAEPEIIPFRPSHDLLVARLTMDAGADFAKMEGR